MPCCNVFHEYSPMAMQEIDKTLGNLRKSHKDIVFAGLLNMRQGQAHLIHYLMEDRIYENVFVEKDPSQAGDTSYERS